MKYTDLQMNIGFSVNAAVSVSQKDDFISVNMLLIIDLFSSIWLICIISPDIVLFYFILMCHLNIVQTQCILSHLFLTCNFEKQINPSLVSQFWTIKTCKWSSDFALFAGTAKAVLPGEA